MRYIDRDDIGPSPPCPTVDYFAVVAPNVLVGDRLASGSKRTQTFFIVDIWSPLRGVGSDCTLEITKDRTIPILCCLAPQILQKYHC